MKGRKIWEKVNSLTLPVIAIGIGELIFWNGLFGILAFCSVDYLRLVERGFLGRGFSHLSPWDYSVVRKTLSGLLSLIGGINVVSALCLLHSTLHVRVWGLHAWMGLQVSVEVLKVPWVLVFWLSGESWMGLIGLLGSWVVKCGEVWTVNRLSVQLEKRRWTQDDEQLQGGNITN